MYIKLLTEQHLDFLSLKGGCTGSSESTLVKMSLFGKNMFVFVALRHEWIAMVMAGWSGHLTTLFSWAGLNKQLTHNLCTYFRLNESTEGRRMTVEIISWSISMKAWDWTGIELATPGSAIRLASEARHVTDCDRRPSMEITCRGSIICFIPYTLACRLCGQQITIKQQFKTRLLIHTVWSAQYCLNLCCLCEEVLCWTANFTHHKFHTV